ncbi:DUF6167 family protein [Actinopolymorpha alba]|uniref:DUF6167 family protein n=1 Tax=Actinopolymorpha alba TaxID=533267 RepID=UPI0003820AC9|nr:DUF6167 family protein [Actinopolymorpha alba]
MKRLFWVVVGAAVGVLVVRKVSQKAEQFTPQGVAKQVAGLGTAIRAFGEEVRAGMDAREAELRDALALDGRQPNGHPGLDADAAARLTRDPNSTWRDTR